MKNKNKNKSKAFTLFEILLAFIVLASLISGVFFFLGKAKTSASVQKEVENAEQIISTISGSFSTTGRIQDISVESVYALKGIPDDMKAGGFINNRFGGTITPAPHRILSDNDSFSLTYSNMDTDECIKFIQAVNARTSSIEVGGDPAALTVVQKTSLNGSVALSGDARVDDIAAVNACAQGAFKNQSGFVKLIIFGGNTANVGLANPPTACSCVNNQKETALNPCPVGQAGAITQTRNGTCSGGTADCPTNVWGAWSTISNTCAPIATGPGPSTIVTTPGAPCIPETQSRTRACPAGMIGTIIEAQTSSCAAATGSPTWSNVWVETSNTCVLLSGPCRPTVVTDPAPPSCPIGQCGAIVRQKTMTCNAAGNFVPPSPDVWVITQNTCIDENAPSAFCAKAKPKCVAAPVVAAGQCSTGPVGCIDCGQAFDSGNGTIFQMLYKNPPGEYNSSCHCSQGGTLTSNGTNAAGARIFSCQAPNVATEMGPVPPTPVPAYSQFAWNPTTGEASVWDASTGARIYTLSQANTAAAYCPGDKVSRRYNGSVNTVTVTRGSNFKSTGTFSGWSYGYCSGVNDDGSGSCVPEAKLPVASIPDPNEVDQVGCFSGVTAGLGLMGGGFGQEDQLCSKCTKFSADGRTCEVCAGDLRTVYCQ